MRRNRFNRKSEDKGAPKWMVTYSDMVTLILVFFILLFTMSQIDAEKFRQVAEALRAESIFESKTSIMEEDNVLDENGGMDQDEFKQMTDSEEDQVQEPQVNTEVIRNADTLDELLAEVKSFLNENNLNNVISASRTDQGVVLVLQENVLFDSGEAELLDPAKPFLDKVSALIENIPNQIRVEGHTDNRPISNYRFPSNWELSAARASSVIRYILETNTFDSSRFIAAGYGETRPVAPNNSTENWSKNRRVEIVILELSETE